MADDLGAGDVDAACKIAHSDLLAVVELFRGFLCSDSGSGGMRGKRAGGGGKTTDTDTCTTTRPTEDNER